ncbi:MAG TPA: SCO family protein [Propionibacterium sp.]|nr:SCO family protein [Propionibacterium sp.]
MRRCLIAVALVGALLVTACTASGAGGAVVPKAPQPSWRFHGAWQDRPFVLPDQTFRDTSGQRFNLRKSPSRPVTLVLFSYPDCPHGCAGTLMGLATALDRVPTDVHDDVTVLVVDLSPEPAPDHRARLRAWLDEFDPQFVGLTGTPDQVQELAGSLGVAIHPDNDGGLMHGDQIIGFDRDDRGVLLWTSDVPVDQLSQDLVELVARQR